MALPVGAALVAMRMMRCLQMAVCSVAAEAAPTHLKNG